MSIRLGVNIDHVATIRNARGEKHPDPLLVAKKALQYGADSITIHLREDRRHINDNDLKLISSIKSIPLNLEMASNPQMLKIAIKHKPDFVCIVPEKRQELTTEGGLDVKKNFESLKNIIHNLKDSGSLISLFIEPDIQIIDLAKELNVGAIELHTGKYAEANNLDKKKYIEKIINSVNHAHNKSLIVNAGHGLDYTNVKEIARISNINELNIGHSIIAESIFLGLAEAINKMKNIIVSN